MNVIEVRRKGGRSDMLHTVLFLFLAAAFFTDIRSMRIPNGLNGAAVLTGLVLHAAFGGWRSLAESGLGVVAGFGVVLLLHFAGAVGAGDVKLFAAIGALSGASFTLSALAYSILYAGCFGLVLALFRRKLAPIIKDVAGSMLLLLTLRDTSAFTRWRSGTGLQFPFMAAVLPGAVTAYIAWYW
jgi:prepilin peptidase CpaA